MTEVGPPDWPMTAAPFFPGLLMILSYFRHTNYGWDDSPSRAGIKETVHYRDASGYNGPG